MKNIVTLSIFIIILYVIMISCRFIFNWSDIETIQKGMLFFICGVTVILFDGILMPIISGITSRLEK